MSTASMTASMSMRCASTTSMRAAAGVHAAAEAVGLPADDGVEAPVPGVGEHALELGALLGPAASHLLVARGDGVAALLAVGLHVADLLGEGGLVVLGLALVGDARVDGGAAVLGLSWFSGSRHGCLLRIQDPPPCGGGSASSSMRLASPVHGWRHGPGCCQHRRATSSPPA